MKTIAKFSLIATIAILSLMIDMKPQSSRLLLGYQFPNSFHLISEAEAVLGRQRRTRRRGVAVGYAAGTASTAAVAQSQQAAAAQQQVATTQPQAVTVQPQPASVGGPPTGSIVTMLPTGCATVVIGGVQYFDCSGVFYRAAFQGNNLVYVVTQP